MMMCRRFGTTGMSNSHENRRFASTFEIGDDYMNFLNFSDIRVLLIGILITVVVLGVAWMKKKSFPAAILLFVYLGLLIFHLVTMGTGFSVFIDFAGIIVSITIYLVIDEIEIRRSKINQVFEDRYK